MKTKQNPFEEYFLDTNIDFPQKPMLKDGINVYIMPKGLGVQYRGGIKRTIIRGENASIIWNCIHPLLNGKNTLEDIFIFFEKSNNNISSYNLSKFLKLLHSKNLLCIESEKTTAFSIDYFSNKQKEYYKRTMPYLRDEEMAVNFFHNLKNLKILLISEDEIAPLMAHNLSAAGIEKIGYLITKSCSDFNIENFISNSKKHFYKDIENTKTDELRTILDRILPDFNIVISLFKNPSAFFEREIIKLCFLNDVPYLNISIVENIYTVGPFFFPNSDTACPTCYKLRQQSYELDSIYDYLYHKNLETKEIKSCDKIKGFDIPSINIILNIAIKELINSTCGISNPFLVNNIVQIDSTSLNIEKIQVLKVSGCPSCN